MRKVHASSFVAVPFSHVWKLGTALEVYDSNLKLVHTHRIPAGGQPGQICMAGKGEEHRRISAE